MTIEAASFISELNPALPDDNDAIPEGDDHIRLTKSVLGSQFPNFTAAAVNPTVAELNHSVGVTSGIQAQIDATVAATSTNATNIGTNDTDIAALQAADVTHDSRLDGIDADQITQNNRLTATEGQTTTNTGNISTNTTNIGTNTGDISAIEAEQVTQNGRLTTLEGDSIPATTRMLFRQASVPTGWTLVADNDDRVIRNRSGTGGGAAGSWVISGLTNSAVGSHVLTEAEMPAHTHTGPSHTHPAGTLTGDGSTIGSGSAGRAALTSGTLNGTVPITGNTAAAGTGNTGSKGGGAGHTHTTPTISSSGAWRPAYVDVVTGAKN